MKATLTLLAFLFTVCAAGLAQVVPEATGPGLPVSGKLHFDLRYSETAAFGGYQDGQQRIYASGDAGYANDSERLPFTMQYGGGYGWTFAGPAGEGGVFQHLSLTQGIVGRSWNLTASDNVSYTFETPTTGFSGVPGSGEPIGGSGSAIPPDQTVLTLNTRMLDNFTTLAAGHRLDFATSLSLGGSSGQMRFIDGNGLDTDMLMADAGITRRLNARNSLAGQYSFSRYSYGSASSTSSANAAQLGSLQVNTTQLSFTRQWSRHFHSTASAGPQWISSANSAVVPSSTNVAASASVSDTFRVGTASLNYSHGVQGGSGYLLGAENDTASADFTRKLGRNATVGVTGSYRRTAGLNDNGVTSGKYAGAQASRRLGRDFNVFADYTALDQSSSSTLSINALSGLTQIIGFGIGYSPRGIHLRH
jgi:hypothetical protein